MYLSLRMSIKIYVNWISAFDTLYKLNWPLSAKRLLYLICPAKILISFYFLILLRIFSIPTAFHKPTLSLHLQRHHCSSSQFMSSTCLYVLSLQRDWKQPTTHHMPHATLRRLYSVAVFFFAFHYKHILCVCVYSLRTASKCNNKVAMM